MITTGLAPHYVSNLASSLDEPRELQLLHFKAPPHFSFLHTSVNIRFRAQPAHYVWLMSLPFVAKTYKKNLFQRRHILMPQRDSLDMGSIFKKLKHGSIVIGC